MPAWAVLVIIVLVGGALRFYQVGSVPPGLYQDEAYNGLDALNILGGWHPLYFPANNGREPLYMYAAAAGVAVFGRTALAERIPAPVIGTLLIAATFALGQALGMWKVITPKRLGFTGAEADRLAGNGLVMMTGWKDD